MERASWTLVEMRAQFIDRREPHHAFGHLRLDRAVGIQRIGHSIDDARFENRDRRLFLVARGRRIAIRAGAPAGSVNVEGARPLRRAMALLTARERSDFGQASSNVTGGGAALAWFSAAAARQGRGDQPRTDRSSAPGRARAPSAMTKKTTDCAAAWRPARPRPARPRRRPPPRSRDAASSCHGGGGHDGCRFRIAWAIRHRLSRAEQETVVFRA